MRLGAKRFSCDECNRKFSHYRSLKQHHFGTDCKFYDKKFKPWELSVRNKIIVENVEYSLDLIRRNRCA